MSNNRYEGGTPNEYSYQYTHNQGSDLKKQTFGYSNQSNPTVN